MKTRSHTKAPTATEARLTDRLQLILLCRTILCRDLAPVAHNRRPGEGFVKVVGWYDNEWGYSSRTADLANFMAEKGL